MFVVGKGGVGKTTTAGALALASADAGVSTRLLSTDPAHSLGDLFGIPLAGGRPTPSPCSERLVLEELDAAAYAADWIGRVRAPLLELFDRGTYLDPEDVAGFLDLSLPGVDEIAAVLRLADLAAEPEPRRVFVDTAPTGHTLRLLDAPAVIEGWTEAFDAMESKAAVVLSSIARRPVRLAADEVVRDLRARVERFQETVLAAGEAVVVERAGTPVESESRRLRDALPARGLPVAVRVLTLAPGEDPAATEEGEEAPDEAPVAIPWREGLSGCDLRAWGSAPETSPGPEKAPERGRPAAPLLRALDVDLLLFVGKGGVGKTTCAAAAALGMAGDRPVALLGTDPAGSLADVLDRAIPREGTDIGGVRVRELEAGVEFQEFRDRYQEDVARAFERLGEGLALDRRVVESLLELAPPGADELFAVLALLEAAGEGALLVVDAAPTGHLLRLLEMPRLALEWTHQLMRVLIRYRSALGLDAFAERLLDFAKQLKHLDLRLRDPARSAAVVVTLPGPLVAAETHRLEASLEEMGVRVAARLLNRAPAEAAKPAVRERPGDAAPPRIRAPAVRPEPVGPDALGDFFQQWTLEP